MDATALLTSQSITVCEFRCDAGPDDAPFAEYLSSPLSVIRQDVEGIGGTAAELLIEKIRTGRKSATPLHRIPVEFVVRESIGPPKRSIA